MSDNYTPQIWDDENPNYPVSAERMSHIEDGLETVDEAAQASAATAQAFAIQRANHTGTQTASTISDFATAADARITLQKGVNSGLASLDGSGKLTAGQLPAIAVNNVYTVASQTAMLALSANPGDMAVRSDLTQTFILAASPASTLANWVQVSIDAAPVTSVASKTGAVSLVKGDVGLGNVDNTADATKAVLSASKLTTARTIAGKSFDGTANISIAAGDVGAATSAQGAKADSAVQPDSLATVATSGAYGDLTGLPTLGTAAAADSTAFDAAGTAAALTALHKAPLVVDGTLVREGGGGAIYKATGYNATFVPNIYTSSQTLTGQAIDRYFAQLRPNSLTRLRAYAPPSASGISWATQLATLDNVVNSARKHGQRLIMCFTTWTSIDSAGDAYAGKSSTWFTSSTYKHSVSGSTSYEDWVTAVVSRYTSDGTVCIYDLLNEPQDSGSNSASVASFVTYMSGVIKAIDPTALVYMGIDLVSSVGGVTAYETINAGADFCSSHDYAAQGFVNTDIGVVAGARALSKPWIMDETGVWAKQYYGLSGDTDKDDTGWPAVTFQAQGRLLERKIATAVAEADCFAVLDYSYMDSSVSGGWFTDGKGHYEPPNEGLARTVLRSAALQGDEFNNSTLASTGTGGWLDGAQAFRYAPGAAMAACIARQATNTVSVTSATAPTAGRWNKSAGWQFNGAQFMNLGFYKAWGTALTHMWAFVPVALPTSGAYCYLVAPQGSALGLLIRINPSGQIEVDKYSTATAALSATGGASTNAVVLSQVNTLGVTQNTSTGALKITLNGVLTSLTGKNPAYAAANAIIGADQAGANGFNGYLLEAINEQIVETDTNVGLTLAYFGRRYDAAA